MMYYCSKRVFISLLLSIILCLVSNSSFFVGAEGTAADAPSTSCNDHSFWLDDEMKKIPFHISSSATTQSSTLLQTVQSFYNKKQQTSSSEQSSLSSSYKNPSDELQRTIHDSATSIQPLLISIRRLLHRYPELMYQERITSQVSAYIYCYMYTIHNDNVHYLYVLLLTQLLSF